MQGTVVGILRGGPSREHDISVRSGHALIQSLPPERYTVRDIFIDREGTWHERGLRTTPERVLPHIDVALVALHGEYGEDGEVQKVLERFGTPYTGSKSFPSFESMHKILSKEKARAAGIQVPRYEYFESIEGMVPRIQSIIRTYPQPVMVKPVRWGSSIGVTAPTGFQPVHQAVTGLFAEGADAVIIEEYIRGRETSVGVIEHMRNEKMYTLPAVEIVPPHTDPFFTYEAKFAGSARAIAPAQLPREIMDELGAMARRMHQELHLRHYSSSDFIVSPKGIFYLETNALPGLSESSVMPQALASVGISPTQFVEHLIALALGREGL